MIKDSGTVVLTPNDLAEFEHGHRVSTRVRATWGLTYEELADVIKNKKYITTEGLVNGSEVTGTQSTSGEVTDSSSS